MCGIFGIIQKNCIDSNTFSNALNSIAHRGPDDAGLEIWTDHNVGLGHRRLSIIDLSPAGHNPMANEDGTVWIVFNGEIYNFQELRRELEQAGHHFRSNTDTEVIIHAYEEWGDEHVHRLRGMFAYALYDRRSQAQDPDSNCFRLLLVRDRLGIKPLVYYWYQQTLLFASEPKAILAYPGVDRAIDRTALFDYLTYRYIPAPKTAYQHIRKLLPGHYLIFENDQLNLRQYWDVPLLAPSPVATFDQAVELVRATLEEAVRYHMISDVPVGVFLSGGLDSSAVTALMSGSTTESIRTFSIGFDLADYHETDFARLVARHYHTQHDERIIGSDSMEKMLPLVTWMYDEPYADNSAIPTYRVSEVARDQVKVVLAGDGGDEIFAGYRWYSHWLKMRPFDRIPLSLRRGLFSSVGSMLPRGRRGSGFIPRLAMEPLAQYAHLLEVFSPAEKKQLLSPDWAKAFDDYDDYWYFRQHWREELDPLTRIQYLDLKTYLPDDILTKVDRASMAVSLEVRPPLLDHVLVEQLFAIPAHFRAPNGHKKHLMKCAVRDLLPASILNRPKQGFGVPTAWMQTEKEWIKQQLQTHQGLGLFRENIAEHFDLFNSGTKAWALLLLQQWWLNEV